MLPKHNRLTNFCDIELVKLQGNLFHSKNFKLITLVRETNEHSRFALIVSSFVSKKAVVRNRLRRLIRESLRPQIPQLKKGYDCVIIAKSSAKELNLQQTKAEVSTLLSNAKITN